MLCCPTELAAYEHGLMPFAKHRHCCLGCCEKDAAYLAQWHRTKDWLHKHKPCSGCAVTLVSGQGKPLRQAVQQDESPTPFSAQSNTTTVRNSSCQPLHASLLTGQDPKNFGIHDDVAPQLVHEQKEILALLLDDQKDLSARVAQLQSLADRVGRLEEQQQQEDGYVVIG